MSGAIQIKPEAARRVRRSSTAEGSALDALLEPGQVVELRAFMPPNPRGFTDKLSGYFDDHAKLESTAMELEQRGASGIYFTLNPVAPELLARSANRARIIRREPCTTDADVIRRRWLPIDLDPQRPAGISATEEEKQKAWERTRDVAAFVKERGFPDPVAGDSGNGFHLLYRIDLPPEDDLVERTLRALDQRFSDEHVKIDTSVHNPSRIWKLYGTTTRKGDDTPERPHRRSKLLHVPPEQLPVPRELLEQLASEHHDQAKLPDNTGLPTNGHADGPPIEEEIPHVLGFLPDRLDYEDWLKAITAVLDKTGGDKLSAEAYLKGRWPEEREGEYAEKLANPLTRVGWGTVVNMARQRGYDPSAYYREWYRANGRNGHSKKRKVPGAELSWEAGHSYVGRGGQLLLVNDDSARVIADFEAAIKVELTRESGDRIYHLEGRTQKQRPFSLEIDAAKFEDDRALKAAIGSAAGAEAAVRARMSTHLSSAIKLLSTNVERRQRYERTGWSPHGFLIPGRAFETVEIVLERRLPYELPDADLELGREALRCLIESIGPGRTVPALAFALTGPVARALRLVKRYGLAIYGRTGSLKTSFVQALMCLYGPGFLDDENLLKMGEGMTRNAAMKLAAIPADLPIFFDNYKPNTGGGDRDFISLIHNIIEGGDKARLDRGSNLRESFDIRAWPVFTGEDLPNTDAASLARMLAVGFEWQTGEPNPALTRAQELSAHLPAIGRAWIEYLESSDGAAAAATIGGSFHDRRARWAEYLRGERPDMVNTLRVASNLAANEIVFDIASACPAFGDVLADYESDYRLGLEEIAYRMGDFTATSLEAKRLLAGLRSLLDANRVSLPDRQETAAVKNLVGWQDARGYYLLVDVALEAVNELYRRSGGLTAITNEALYAQFKGLDLIASTDSGRMTKTIRVKGYDKATARVLHLKRAALDDEDSVAAAAATESEPGAGSGNKNDLPF